MKFKEFVDERGFLTQEGKLLANRFSVEIDGILMLARSENELRLLGSILSSIVGDKVASHVRQERYLKK